MSETLPKTHKGKVGRLPAKIREEVCRRIHDGQTAGQIIPWLNGLPDTVRVCNALFEGNLITPQNLSDWRMGGFMIWREQQDEIEATRDRARYSLELSKASGGNLSEGALAQLTGEVMELLEEVSALRKAGAEMNPKALAAVAKILTAIRARELDTHTSRLNQKRLEQKDRELDLAEAAFRMKTAEMFLQFFDHEETRRIATSGERKETKVKELVQLWFGEMPEGIGPPSLQ
ncbi:MAG TPA: hypothetical protein VGE39_02510 [Prosthecobacter sp.]